MKPMKNAVGILLSSSLTLALAGTKTVCHFGVRYAISQIPAERRSRMGDFDCVGIDGLQSGAWHC